MASKERYTSVIGGTVKKAHFKSASRINERNNKNMNKGKKPCVYLNSVWLAATVTSKQIQERADAKKATDDQVATFLMALKAKDKQVNKWRQASVAAPAES